MAEEAGLSTEVVGEEQVWTGSNSTRESHLLAFHQSLTHHFCLACGLHRDSRRVVSMRRLGIAFTISCPDDRRHTGRCSMGLPSSVRTLYSSFPSHWRMTASSFRRIEFLCSSVVHEPAMLSETMRSHVAMSKPNAS